MDPEIRAALLEVHALDPANPFALKASKQLEQEMDEQRVMYAAFSPDCYPSLRPPADDDAVDAETREGLKRIISGLVWLSCRFRPDMDDEEHDLKYLQQLVDFKHDVYVRCFDPPEPLERPYLPASLECMVSRLRLPAALVFAVQIISSQIGYWAKAVLGFDDRDAWASDNGIPMCEPVGWASKTQELVLLPKTSTSYIIRILTMRCHDSRMSDYMRSSKRHMESGRWMDPAFEERKFGEFDGQEVTFPSESAMPFAAGLAAHAVFGFLRHQHRLRPGIACTRGAFRLDTFGYPDGVKAWLATMVATAEEAE